MLAALGLGCGAGSRQAGEAARADRPAEPAPAQQARAENDAAQAQRAWCEYLQALYLRAAEGAAGWPRLEQCLQARTMASPKMLRQTAECSLRALQSFPGDPFTVEYAAEVSRCGAAALDMSAASAADLAPYVAAICGRVAACEAINYAECRESLEQGLGPHLRRAVGAMNERGREQLRTCFGGVSCVEIGQQISACLEPIMDSLLWLPG
jgi:hypothetical protein